MGEFIVVLKYMHVRYVLFDHIVLTNAPMVWFERQRNPAICSVMILLLLFLLLQATSM